MDHRKTKKGIIDYRLLHLENDDLRGCKVKIQETVIEFSESERWGSKPERWGEAHAFLVRDLWY